MMVKARSTEQKPVSTWSASVIWLLTELHKLMLMIQDQFNDIS